MMDSLPEMESFSARNMIPSLNGNNNTLHQNQVAFTLSASSSSSPSSAPNTAAGGGGGTISRYENQKRRDWNTFGQYLKNHKPPLALSRCSGAHVLEFLRYLDQFGKTKVHNPICPFYGHPNPPAPCPCPLRQAWGSLDALIGRLRAAFEENGGKPEANPFGARAVRLYLREVRDLQSKARGISYEKKKRKHHHHHGQAGQPPPPPPPSLRNIPAVLPPPVISTLGLHHGGGTYGDVMS